MNYIKKLWVLPIIILASCGSMKASFDSGANVGLEHVYHGITPQAQQVQDCPCAR